MKEIKNSGIMHDILSDLGLPKDFYDLPYKSDSSPNEMNEVWGELDRFDGDSSDDESVLSQSNPLTLSSRSSCPVADNPESSLLGKSSQHQNFIKMKSHTISQIGKYSASETFHLHRISQSHSSRYRSSTKTQSFENDRCSIEVELMDGSKRTIEIEQSTRGFDLCQTTARRIGLKSYLDHRIFLKDSRGNYRVLDDEENVMKALFPQQKHLYSNAQLVMSPKPQQPKNNNHDLVIVDEAFSESNIADDGVLGSELQNSRLWVYSKDSKSPGSLWKRMWRNLKKLKHYTIVFKKYLWLSSEQEEIDIRQDPVRLKLISYQIFNEILQERFQLTHKQYALFASLHFYIEQDGAFEPLSIHIDRIKEKIPRAIFNQKPATFWMESVAQTLVMLAKEINTIHQLNSAVQAEDDEVVPVHLKQSTTSNVTNNGRGSTVAERIQALTVKSIFKEKVQLMQMVVINAIKDNPLFGVTQFYVNTYKETLRFAKESQVKIEENVWLGIKHNMLFLLGPEFKENLLTINYDSLLSKRVFPKQIHLSLSLKGVTHDWRFITSTSLEISQLISEYQNINSLLRNTQLNQLDQQDMQEQKVESS